MKIQIATPFSKDSKMGNSTSARRISSVIGQELEIPTEVVDPNDTITADLLIALHAERSSNIIRDFKKTHPQRPLVLILPGSDLYGSNSLSQTTLESMRHADALVVSQEASLADIPEEFVEISHLVPKSPSAELPPRNLPRSLSPFRVLLASHLREQKNPQLAIAAARLLPRSSRVLISHHGKSLDPKFAEEATSASRVTDHYQWLGDSPHPEVLLDLADSHLALNTSTMEGGANSLCEAIHLGVPIIASDIPGNRGMLGEDYPGYFSSGAAGELAEVLQRAEKNRSFLHELTQATKARIPLFTRRTEAAAWREVIEPLLGEL